MKPALGAGMMKGPGDEGTMGCDYPAEAYVKDGITYDYGAKEGTLEGKMPTVEYEDPNPEATYNSSSN